MRVIGDCHVGGREGNAIDYLMRCSACRDFIMFQKRNKFATNNRRRYVRTKGRLAMVDVDAGDICGSSESAVISNNGCKRARGDTLIGAAWSSSAS